MSFSPYYGNYAAIVLQNNDPERRGRVKIFVPHISPTVYKGWNEIDKDKQFKFVGLNIQSDLTPVLEDLKRILPWADCAAPLVGANTIGRFNNPRNIASISDTSDITTFASASGSTSIDYAKITQYSQNLDSIGEKPGNRFDINSYRVNDAFNTPENHVNNVNHYSYNYTPQVHSNAAKGSFSIPNVGAHVWVFFVEGDPQRPVYFATSFSKTDWESVYTTDYPSDYENKALSANEGFSLDTDTYRNRYIINQKGGTLEFNNTDKNESVRLSHYSGSFKAYTNQTAIELATKNDQKLILKDQFLTVRGDKNLFVGMDYDQVITGNMFTKAGNFNITPVTLWKAIVAEIADVKQLFDIRRAVALTSSVLKLTSSQQTQNGSPAACPVCAGSQSFYWRLNNSTGSVSVAYQSSEGGGPYSLQSVQNVAGANTSPASWGIFGKQGTIFGETCPSCGGTGKSTSSMNGTWDKEIKKDELNLFIKNKTRELAELEKQMGLGGSWIVNVTKHKHETIGLVVNDFGSVRVDEKGKMDIVSVVIGKEGVFENRLPTPLVEYVQVDDLPGGTYSLDVCNKYNVTVGSGGMSLKTSGPVNISGTITNIAGTQVNIGSTNEVNIDGGRRLNLVADVVSLKQRNKLQVLVDSSLGVTKNVVVGGGMHVEGELTVNHITAPGEIQETENTVVFGTAAKDVTGRGTTTGSGTPLYSTRLGAPSYVGIPDPALIIGYVYVPPNAGGTYPVFGSGMPSIRGSQQGQGGPSIGVMPIEVYGTGAEDDCFVSAPHSHNFKNIPLTLTESNDATREIAKNCNEPERVPADPIYNAKK